jgi:phosphoribosylformylglycinamidine (FGAM) synthase-like enzyme
VGAVVDLPASIDPFVALFSESTARAVVVVPLSEELRFTALCAAKDLPAQRIGVVDSQLAVAAGFPEGTQVLEVSGLFAVPLEDLRAASAATLPALFG